MVAFVSLSTLPAIVFIFGINVGLATPDVMLDAMLAQQCKYYPRFASDLQSLCWGAYTFFSIAGYGLSGIVLSLTGPRAVFAMLVLTAGAVFLFTMLGFVQEKEVRKLMETRRQQVDAEEEGPPLISDSHSLLSSVPGQPLIEHAQPPVKTYLNGLITTDNTIYRSHPRAVSLGLYISFVSCAISILVMVVENWVARFVVIFGFAVSVVVAVWVSTAKTMPEFANIALFIFLRESLTPDLETVMFYWYRSTHTHH
jgi:hypothetical protein